jgi:hypothetical protein
MLYETVDLWNDIFDNGKKQWDYFQFTYFRGIPSLIPSLLRHHDLYLIPLDINFFCV